MSNQQDTASQSTTLMDGLTAGVKINLLTGSQGVSLRDWPAHAPSTSALVRARRQVNLTAQKEQGRRRSFFFALPTKDTNRETVGGADGFFLWLFLSRTLLPSTVTCRTRVSSSISMDDKGTTEDEAIFFTFLVSSTTDLSSYKINSLSVLFFSLEQLVSTLDKAPSRQKN